MLKEYPRKTQKAYCNLCRCQTDHVITTGRCCKCGTRIGEHR